MGISRCVAIGTFRMAETFIGSYSAQQGLYSKRYILYQKDIILIAF
jgi:hypothetical protein